MSYRRCLLLLTVVTSWPLLNFSAHAQRRNSSPLSLGVGGGLHAGSLAGVNSFGPTLSAIGWLRILPAFAARVDGAYAYNVTGGVRLCAVPPGEECPSGGPLHVSSIGASAMLGSLASNARRAYVLAGADLLYARGRSAWRDRITTVPKVGVGVASRSLFAELSGRWGAEWEEWHVRHWVFLIGVLR